jgi:hypothetical protein
MTHSRYLIFVFFACECRMPPLQQLSSESLMQHMSSKKAQANANATRGSPSGHDGSPGTSSTARRRSRKESSVGVRGAAGAAGAAGLPSAPTPTSTTAIVSPRPADVTPAAAVEGVPGAVAVPAPTAPWFKRLSVNTLTLTVDYNVRRPGLWLGRSQLLPYPRG